MVAGTLLFARHLVDPEEAAVLVECVAGACRDGGGYDDRRYPQPEPYRAVGEVREVEARSRAEIYDRLGGGVVQVGIFHKLLYSPRERHHRHPEGHRQHQVQQARLKQAPYTPTTTCLIRASLFLTIAL